MKKIATIVTLMLVMTSISSAEVHFQNISFKEALKLAAKQHKIVMVDYYTSWCGWCKRLDKDTYSADDVGAYTDKNMICLKVDAEQGEGVELARNSKVGAYPTIVFYNPKGNEIHRLTGYQKPPAFLGTLQTAVEKQHSAE